MVLGEEGLGEFGVEGYPSERWSASIVLVQSNKALTPHEKVCL